MKLIFFYSIVYSTYNGCYGNKKLGLIAKYMFHFQMQSCLPADPMRAIYSCVSFQSSFNLIINQWELSRLFLCAGLPAKKKMFHNFSDDY